MRRWTSEFGLVPGERKKNLFWFVEWRGWRWVVSDFTLSNDKFGDDSDFVKLRGERFVFSTKQGSGGVHLSNGGVIWVL